ncbi:MAG: tRNA 2-thiouridine(34) synthase MnmA [Fimbriimonadaceae bacterium]|nr:tRNA 2-thiouridine(34) synthase MnmA [Fimbriimonadaceae bacterium]
MNLKNKGPILVAMSGGVDSSVAAALMVKRGYDVVGMTMQIWQESQTDPRHAGCCSLGAVEDARRVARMLGIPHYVINFKEEFKQAVIKNFMDEYAEGRTPNPCVQCNKKVKFHSLMEKMHELGCKTLVTGHYARIRRDAASGRYRLMKARGSEKDQSYVLYMLGQEELSQSWFPLGELPDKSVTRAMAAELGLHVAGKPDSQEICFVSEAGGYREFLRKNRPDTFKEGEIVDADGKVLGKHEGVADYTVGQRKGLGLTVRSGKPLYVLGVDPASNRVTVSDDDRMLLQTDVLVGEPYWGVADPDGESLRVVAKIRYNMDPQPATLVTGPVPKLVFDKPVRAVSPGQIAVAYRGQSVAMGGTILRDGPQMI